MSDCDVEMVSEVVVPEVCSENLKYLKDRRFLTHALSFRRVTFRTLSQSNHYAPSQVFRKPGRHCGVRHGRKQPAGKGPKI